MEKQTVFVPHKIESEKDLPKKGGIYFVSCKDFSIPLDVFSFDPNCDTLKKTWLEYVDWWLEARELPSKEKIKKIIPYKNIGWINGADWLKSLLTK
jgi:hypothetical protein